MPRLPAESSSLESTRGAGSAVSTAGSGRPGTSPRRGLAIGLLLVSSGLLLELPAGRETPPVEAAAPFGAEEVAEALSTWNPHLGSERAARVGRAVSRYSDKYGLDPELVTAVLLVESSARPWARSPKGAVGLMQVMPYMLAPLDLAGSPATVETNVEAGCRILAGNIARLGEERGISAYFWGSDIRGVAYLERVQAARAALLDGRPS